MNFHIVRTNETIEDISLIYNVDIDEIKENNKHIRIWDNLSPGLKIRLPEISESLAIEIDDVEPFIEDYYPKLSPLNKGVEKVAEEVIPVTVEQKEQSLKSNTVKQFNYYPYYYNPYFQYYRYYHRGRKPQK
jgi:hypothetical protein